MLDDPGDDPDMTLAAIAAAIREEVKCGGYAAEADEGGGPPLEINLLSSAGEISRIFPRSRIVSKSFWSSEVNFEGVSPRICISFELISGDIGRSLGADTDPRPGPLKNLSSGRLK